VLPLGNLPNYITHCSFLYYFLFFQQNYSFKKFCKKIKNKKKKKKTITVEH